MVSRGLWSLIDPSDHLIHSRMHRLVQILYLLVWNVASRGSGFLTMLGRSFIERVCGVCPNEASLSSGSCHHVGTLTRQYRSFICHVPFSRQVNLPFINFFINRSNVSSCVASGAAIAFILLSTLLDGSLPCSS